MDYTPKSHSTTPLAQDANDELFAITPTLTLIIARGIVCDETHLGTSINNFPILLRTNLVSNTEVN